MLLGIASYT